jgi:large subunit ribosomal protein L31e
MVSGTCLQGWSHGFASLALALIFQEWHANNFQGTKDVRLDPQLNKKVWEAGIKGVPFRLRVRISRKRNDEEGAKEKLYSYVQAVNVKDPKGLHTQVVEDA